MFKKLRGLKNEIEAKFIKKDQDQDKELDDLLQKRKRMIALIMYNFPASSDYPGMHSTAARMTMSTS